jgi:hypothetical protein
MTWAERVGDLAANVVLVIINFLRIFTLLLRIAAEWIDRFVTNLAERSEGGISRAGSTGNAWISLPASVAWGIAAVVLRASSVITVFARQITATLDGFLEDLAGEAGGEPEPPPTPPPYSEA